MKSKKTAKKFYKDAHTGHRLISRRDFISHGFLAGFSAIAAPTLPFVLSQNAFACNGLGNNISASGLSFISLELAGGANISGNNFMVGGPGGQKDYLNNGYEKFGLTDSLDPSKNLSNLIDESFGIAMHAQSPMLQGMLQTTSPETRAHVDGFILCNSSQNDTNTNPLNPIHWVAASGTQGELVKNIGTSSSDSGARSIIPKESYSAEFKPVRIDSANGARDLLSTGRLLERIQDEGKVNKVLKTIERLSGLQLSKLNSVGFPSVLKELADCSYKNAPNIIDTYSAEQLDPRNNLNITNSFGALAGGDNERMGTLCHLILNGLAGAGSIVLGGYDYHNNPRATTELRDFQAGQLIGRALESARLHGKDLCIHISTDGGIAANTATVENVNVTGSDSGDKYRLTSDRQGTSLGVMLFYKHQGSGRPKLRSQSRQLGHYSHSTSEVNTKANLISQDATNLTKAVFANYLHFQGKIDLFDQIVKNDPFADQLENYLIIDKNS